jgi:hypothetical protein
MANETKQREKEDADRKKAETEDHARTFELNLGDVDKPQLKLVEKKTDVAGAKGAKPKGPRPNDDPAEAALEDDDSPNQADGDPIRRETLNILGDLIDLAKSPRTVGR